MHCIHKKVIYPIFVVLLSVLLIANPVQSQETNTKTAFTATDTFSIPELNGNIRFGFNGSYTEAKLENNTWFFKGLELNNTQALATYGFTDIIGLENLAISTKDSNVTVQAFVSFNFSWTSQVFIYSTEGYGSQTIDLGLNASESTGVAEWSVLVDEGATFLAEGSGWELQDDNTIVVDDVGGNITVMHFDFGDDAAMANLSFIMQHYVIILTVGVVAAVVVAAVLIKVIRKRKKTST